jgi:hypothetical protein
VLRGEQRAFVSAGGDALYGFDFSVAYDQGSIEVVYRWANVAGKKIEDVADLRR